eukprot:113462-Pleurochrysis_carterae.AAC.2
MALTDRDGACRKSLVGPALPVSGLQRARASGRDDPRPTAKMCALRAWRRSDPIWEMSPPVSDEV